jgi:RimJ/RimL family protein N-acetyltransferase
VDEVGVVGLLQRVAARLGRWTFSTTNSIWLCRSLEHPIDVVPAGAELTTRILIDDKSVLIEWLRRRHAEFPWIGFEEEIALAEEEGHMFLAVFDAGEVVAFTKVGVGRTYIQDFQEIIRFPEEDVFFYDIFVLPAYRGKRLAVHMTTRMTEFLRERGFERAWAHIEPWNEPSLRAFWSADYENVAQIRHCRVLGRRFFLRDGSRPLIRFEEFIREARGKPGA